MSERLLIIPDVHQRIHKVKNIIENTEFDKIISLGDWFDNFGDTPKDAEQTAEYILELYDKFTDKFVWCLGNHDVGYIFPQVSYTYSCSGMTLDKFKTIQNVFKNRLNADKLELCYIVQPYDKPIVMSHAGLARDIFVDDNNALSVKSIKAACERALHDCVIGTGNRVLSAGRCRGGRNRYGGITWLDWYCEFKPITGFSQIVGHTTTRDRKPIYHWRPKVKRPPDKTLDDSVVYEIQSHETVNLNLDTHLNHFAILDNTTLTVYDYTKKFPKKC
jgi:hypothetical protein